MSEWKPIETFPWCGGYFVVAREGEDVAYAQIVQCNSEDREVFTKGGGVYPLDFFTHWMQLPDLPIRSLPSGLVITGGKFLPNA